MADNNPRGSSSDVVIEIFRHMMVGDEDNQRPGDNGNHEFPPLMRTMRGRWEPGNVVGSSRKTAVHQLTIPGQHIGLNVATKRGFVYDPLVEPQYESVLKRIERAAKVRDLLHGELVGCKRETHELTKQGVIDWWYWMHELVRRKCARVVSGDFGKQPEGDPRVDFRVLFPGIPRTLHDFELWRENKWPEARPQAVQG